MPLGYITLLFVKGGRFDEKRTFLLPFRRRCRSFFGFHDFKMLFTRHSCRLCLYDCKLLLSAGMTSMPRLRVLPPHLWNYCCTLKTKTDNKRPIKNQGTGMSCHAQMDD